MRSFDGCNMDEKRFGLTVLCLSVLAVQAGLAVGLGDVSAATDDAFKTESAPREGDGKVIVGNGLNEESDVVFGEEEGTKGPENSDGVKYETITVSGCPADHRLPCVPKCCDVRESYASGKECSPSGDYFVPVFADRPNDSEYFAGISPEKRYEYFIGDPCLKNKYLLDVLEFPEDEHYLYSNGTLWYGNHLLGMEEYCVESVNGTPRVFVCFDSKKITDYKFLLYPIGLLISIPLLLLTAAIYLGFEQFRDVQGKSLACHVICLAVAYFFLSLVQLASEELDADVCTAAAFLIQFFFVACFFWLNVLCFDTWRNIRADFENSRRRIGDNSEKTKFVYYSLYAWYGPSLLTVVTLIMDLGPAIPESYLKPKFGMHSCWFQSDAAALPYFYGPVGILIVINIIFFILSARKIYSDQKKYVKLKRTSSQNVNSRVGTSAKIKAYLRALKQCVFLFCVMGINWAAEVVSWIIGGSDVIWLITDVFNTLQGLIIFYLFVIKPRNVRKEVLKKLEPCLGFCSSKCCTRESEHPLSGNDRLCEDDLDEEKTAFRCPKETDIRYIDASVSSLANL